jgi:hypothetical protein
MDRNLGIDEVRSAQRIWPLEQRQRAGVTTVLSILIELEALGAIDGFFYEDGGFYVKPKERAA